MDESTGGREEGKVEYVDKGGVIRWNNISVEEKSGWMGEEILVKLDAIIVFFSVSGNPPPFPPKKAHLITVPI